MTTVAAQTEGKTPGRDEVLQTLGELLEIDSPPSGPESLTSFERWDSLTVISFIAYADESFGKVVSGDEILKVVTVDDLVALVV